MYTVWATLSVGLSIWDKRALDLMNISDPSYNIEAKSHNIINFLYTFLIENYKILHVKNKGKILYIREALETYKVNKRNIVTHNDELNFQKTAIFSILNR